MTTSVYEQIRRDIVSRRFSDGEQLVEIVLANRYGTSRTPVREALYRLHAEQLVARHGRGYVVRESSPEEILDIYEVRTTLEGAAAKAAAVRRTDLDLSRLRAAHEAMLQLGTGDGDARAEANRLFHEALWRASHNATVVDLLIRLNTHLIRYPTSTLTFDDRWEVVLAEHARLVELIEQRDAEGARHLAEHHMEGARDVRLRMYADQPTSPARD
ncbi:GntR family transcriptional regulator [Saccharomonospora piscinae]|uniref:GntR family transcriptional regulator n=1 Tax=Saccharomonospora piscinae TaxID=687388 RepID=UPI0018CC1D97|nr:GntR family transcriptional regulator [Saccharomonospora piscinae]